MEQPAAPTPLKADDWLNLLRRNVLTPVPVPLKNSYYAQDSNLWQTLLRENTKTDGEERKFVGNFGYIRHTDLITLWKKDVAAQKNPSGRSIVFVDCRGSRLNSLAFATPV